MTFLALNQFLGLGRELINQVGGAGSKVGGAGIAAGGETHWYMGGARSSSVQTVFPSPLTETHLGQRVQSDEAKAAPAEVLPVGQPSHGV